MRSAVRTAVLPIAGTPPHRAERLDGSGQYGELRPIVDKPVIRFAIEEAWRAGVENFVFITSTEQSLLESQVGQIWRSVQDDHREVGRRAVFIQQSERHGIGHALLLAREHLEDGPFAVLIPNLLVIGEEAGLKKMASSYRTGTIIGYTERPREKLQNFGVLDFDSGSGAVRAVHEKPRDFGDVSRAAAFGRWICGPDLLRALENTAPDEHGEISLTVAINASIENSQVLAHHIGGLCFDLRQPDGFVQATLAVAMQRPDLAEVLADGQRRFMTAGVTTLRAAAWAERYQALTPLALLAQAIEKDFTGRIALVSSFGADSVALLHMVSRIAKDTPVLFVDTGKLFPETVDYASHLTGMLGLEDVRYVRADARTLHAFDPNGILHESNPDACCQARKTIPLKAALGSFDAWITGRRRHQNATRANLALFEEDEDGRLKINPLHAWTKADQASYVARFGLPAHPLKERGYRSIGCAPCTTPTTEGEDERAGRWRGLEKKECGIHLRNGVLVRSAG